MVFDPFSLVAEPQAPTIPQTCDNTPGASLELTTPGTTILGIDEKYVIGAIAGILVFVFIEEMF